MTDELADAETGYAVEAGWLVEVTNQHTCGAGPDGHYGAHESGCGLVPIAPVADALAALRARRAQDAPSDPAAWGVEDLQGRISTATWDENVARRVAEQWRLPLVPLYRDRAPGAVAAAPTEDEIEDQLEDLGWEADEAAARYSDARPIDDEQVAARDLNLTIEYALAHCFTMRGPSDAEVRLVQARVRAGWRLIPPAPSAGEDEAAALPDAAADRYEAWADAGEQALAYGLPPSASKDEDPVERAARDVFPILYDGWGTYDEALDQAAAEVVRDLTAKGWRPPAPSAGEDEAAVERAVVPLDLLESLHDSDPCWFDHHGGCQAHGYLSLGPGEVCPQREVGDLLAAARGPRTQDGATDGAR